MSARSLSFPALFAVVALGLGGCHTRSPDPMEWKLAGDTPGELQKWFNANLPLMSPALAAEFETCCNNIRVKIYSQDPERRTNLLCQRLDGRTVREVLIEGNTLSQDALTSRLQFETDTLLGLLKQGGDLPAAEQPQWQARVDVRRRSIDHLKQSLTAADQHLAALKMPPH